MAQVSKQTALETTSASASTSMATQIPPAPHSPVRVQSTVQMPFPTPPGESGLFDR
jgi:hypothetical protein